MFIWTIGDAIALAVLVAAAFAFVGLYIFVYARFYWRKFFSKRVQ